MFNDDAHGKKVEKLNFYQAAKRYVAGIGDPVTVDVGSMYITNVNERSQSTVFGFSDYPTHGNVHINEDGSIHSGSFDFDMKYDPNIYGGGWKGWGKLIVRDTATIILQGITIPVGIVGNALEGNFTINPQSFEIHYSGKPNIINVGLGNFNPGGAY